MDKTITKIINDQLEIKLGQFLHEELDVELTKVQNRKHAGFVEIPTDVYKTMKFDDMMPR